MSKSGGYNPRSVEPEIYKFWEDGGYFHAEPDPERKPYVIDIPLPNVTGALHLGHALNNTIQDLLIRHKRMSGYNAMWQPGMDHAGIATQAVVEKRLFEDEGKTRRDIGRAELVKRIWDWKDNFGGRILGQLRQIGCSCDWQRSRFTLDEICAKAVHEAFFRLFKDGLIYRGERLVNWDAHLQTAVADDEIVHETVKGHLWHYRYPILRIDRPEAGPPSVAAGVSPAVDAETVTEAIRRATTEDATLGTDYLCIATTRPETMLGDTAIAVHPDDERYQDLIGKHCLLPLQNRAIPIIADGVLVKPEFGTGCVKVTPAHDPNDYECGHRQGLEFINILSLDGKINDNGGAYAGMDRFEARKKVVADLEAAGLMEKIEPYETEVGHSDRSKTPIEPMLSEQWFVKMPGLCELAMEAVRDGRVRFFPERYAKTYLDWLGEKRDWCISRQLWWGHRIPVWSKRMTRRDWETWLQRDPTTSFLWGEIRDDVCVRLVRDDGRDYLIAGSGDSNRTLETLDRLNADWPRDEAATWYVCLRSLAAESITAEQTTLGEWLEVNGFQQDPDVLDTWFSSALWPFSTLGWPDNYGRGRPEASAVRAAGASPPAEPSACADGSDGGALTDLDYFYPTSTLVTGRGIITLWVARMVMTSLYFNKRVPFSHVYIHPIIQDGQGRTMSKSLGNGVDPLDLIELYGTDGMRFTLTQMATETQDVRMPVKPVTLADGRTVNGSEKFELGRHFCNKLWQAATGFVIPNLSDRPEAGPPDVAAGVPAGRSSTARPLKPKDLEIEDRWILSRLSACIADCDRRLESYQFNELANALYSFFWSDFCDWYVELVKPRLNEERQEGRKAGRQEGDAAIARQVLAWVLDQTLRLMHPVMPFVTEALWKKLNEAAPQRGVAEPKNAEHALIAAAWPDASAWPREAEVEREMEAFQNVIRALRDKRADVNRMRVAAKESAVRTLPKAVVRTDADTAQKLNARMAVLQRLGQCDELEIGANVEKPPESASAILSGVEVYVPLTGLADLDIERKRLSKERRDVQGHLQRLRGKLSNEGFVSKAPPAVVEKERARLGDLEQKLAAIARNLTELGG